MASVFFAAVFGSGLVGVAYADNATVDVQERAMKERERIEALIRSRGIRYGSYPSFSVAVKGQKEDFYAVVDWAYKIDLLHCISMHGITECYLFGQKADATGFFVDEACHQIERNEKNVRSTGVLSYSQICNPCNSDGAVHPGSV
ncbi:uncharacterized protein LOC106764094 isoform X3 [Vigna radiata var. radiata]|uniref:Uncharacterized protein LOC106764094 isoform X3 n=1 Tax=Vigna radiata var. radiata TaxID=3916 RepID=A0A1S3UCV8_VIGRR|nr:uncharacterized protein LOC106764094 isoform X3 [Vigna radiata var. radiata]